MEVSGRALVPQGAAGEQLPQPRDRRGQARIRPQPRHRRVKHAQVGRERLQVERAAHVERVEQRVAVGERERGDCGRERVRVDERERLAAGQCEVAEDAVRQVGHRRQVGLAERAQHPHAGRLTRVQRIDEPRRQLGAHPGCAACEPVHQPQQRGPDDVGGAYGPWPTRWLGSRSWLKSSRLAGVHRHARVRADAGGEAVDGRVRPHRLVDDLPACGHPLDRLGRKLDPAAAAGHVADTASGQVEAGEKEGFAHATRHRSARRGRARRRAPGRPAG